MSIAADVPAVALDGVSFAYRGGPRVLEDVSLEVERGAFLGIAGPNGPRTERRPASTTSRTVTGVAEASWARCET